jgi:hypothetical protein
MPVLMIELEEVQMVETTDESLEAIVTAAVWGYPSNTFIATDCC